MIKLSSIYGMKIFDTNGELLGKVKDIVLNMEAGEIVRVLMKQMKNIKAEELTSFIRENSILYKRVNSAKDIMIVEK